MHLLSRCIRRRGGVGDVYLSKFHTGKVPALETSDGFEVYESNAVAWFRECLRVLQNQHNTDDSLVAKQDPNTKLCGSNLKEETTVIRWASFTNYELLPPIMAWIQPIIGRAPTSPEILKEREEGCELTIRAIEKEIKGKKYLVGDTLTLADLFVVSGLARGYQYVSIGEISRYWTTTDGILGLHQELGRKTPRRAWILYEHQER